MSASQEDPKPPKNDGVPVLDDALSTSSSSSGNYNLVQRQAVRMAHYPKTHFWVAFVVAFALSAMGMILGEFSVSNEEGGWQSRGTDIADRTTQIMMVQEFELDLFFGGEAVWHDVTTNVQPGWQGSDDDDDDDDNDDRRRRLQLLSAQQSPFSLESLQKPTLFQFTSSQFHTSDNNNNNELRQSLPLPHTHPKLKNFLSRQLAGDTSRRLQGCDTTWYTNGTIDEEPRLWPVWKTHAPSRTALEPALVQELCEAEEQTQRVLEEQGLCLPCATDEDGIAATTTNKCLLPYGIVLVARLTVNNGMDMDCAALATAWADYQTTTEESWDACVDFIVRFPTELFTPAYDDACPSTFYPHLVDDMFSKTNLVQYTSTVFATSEDMLDDLYELVNDFGKAGNAISGAYDTQDESFINILADSAVGTDMLLATGSALITMVAILVHTKSPFLTLIGLIQIALSFPLAFFFYKLILGYEFFPFLNFIGVFVVFALGADHVFVAVDKWKNARLDRPMASTEQIASQALPDAASAMLLTTSTTAAAFFGTAICPVAPVRLFAIFCGMLITFDYILDVAIMFPAICIYDGFRHNPNCCITWQRRKKAEEEEEENTADDVPPPNKGKNGDDYIQPTQEMQTSERDSSDAADSDRAAAAPTEEDDDPPIRLSLIRRILLGYYGFLHKIRWPLLVACAAAFVVSVIYAKELDLPTTSDVRLLNDDVEFEQNYQWRQKLLYTGLSQQGGSLTAVIWGVIPADTGDHNNPASWSTLVLDDSFDPSTTQAQVYLRDYCDGFFAAEEEFAALPWPDYQCPINRFDAWLRNQSSAISSLQDDTNGTLVAVMDSTVDNIYLEECNGATELPMDPGFFHSCIVAWSYQVNETSVLSRNGVVEIMYFPFRSKVRYNSPNEDLEKEWNSIDNWMKQNAEDNAPAEVANAFFSSMDFWWYDTNIQMFKTAYGSAAIAIAASAVVILLSSRSLVMTLFSVLSIAYVLASVTAMMVGAGWDLGFLESICFAILIGVSVDFVIHFSHAYVALPGSVRKEVRTKHALIDMGPSILAAAFTTVAGAAIMYFCLITFFRKFAMVLMFAILQATIGSFVVFLTLTDSLGPAEPTYMADKLCNSDKNEDDTADSVSGSGASTQPKEEVAKSRDIPAAPLHASQALLLSVSNEIEC